MHTNPSLLAADVIYKLTSIPHARILAAPLSYSLNMSWQ